MDRIFRHKGLVTDRVDSYEEARFLSADADALEEVAVALGVPVGEITVEHVKVAPSAEKVIPPTQFDPAPPTLEERIAALERDVADLNPGGAVAAALRG